MLQQLVEGIVYRDAELLVRITLTNMFDDCIAGTGEIHG